MTFELKKIFIGMVKITRNHIIILNLKIEKRLLNNKYTEIAKQAGLHPSTVWRILHNQRKNINSIIKVRNAVYQIFHNKVVILDDEKEDKLKNILKIDSKLSLDVQSINKTNKPN